MEKKYTKEHPYAGIKPNEKSFSKTDQEKNIEALQKIEEIENLPSTPNVVVDNATMAVKLKKFEKDKDPSSFLNGKA